LRTAFAVLAAQVMDLAPDGFDKSMTIHHLRTAAMWANVAITRHPDGSPRKN
jgi:hypothetical protein